MEADATATLAAPPETRTSLRRAGECVVADATDEAGAVDGRSGDKGTGAGFLGEVGDAACAWWLLSDGVVALRASQGQKEREWNKRDLLFSLLLSFICFSSSN